MNDFQNMDTQIFTLLALCILIVLWLITVFVSYRRRRPRFRQWLAEYLENISPELFGAILTTILFTLIVGGLERGQTESELKRRLVTQFGSSINSEAIRAAEELDDRSWLRDGSLANADLSFANLQHSNLSEANLRYANLSGANLQGAILTSADLRAASLFNANLRNAQLGKTDLKDAILFNADLQGVDLGGADLKDADLEGAEFDENTFLPDGSWWTPNSDLTRFTSPDHPNFWRSDDPDSPAYHENSQ